MRIPTQQKLASEASQNRVHDSTDQTPTVTGFAKNVTAVLSHADVADWKAGGSQLYALAQALKQAAPAPLPSKQQSLCEVLVAAASAASACATQYRRASQYVPSHLPTPYRPLPSQHLSILSRTPRNAPVLAAPTEQTRLGNAQFHRRHENVIALLRHHAYLQKENPYAAIHIRLVIAAVDYLDKEAPHDNGPRQAALAQRIRQDQSNTTHTDLTPLQQGSLIRHWIEVLLFGNAVEDILVTYLSVHPHRQQLCIPELRDWLYKKTLAQLAKGASEQDGLRNDSHISQWIWEHVINVAMPLLIYHRNTHIASLSLSAPEFGQYHSGVLFARITGQDAESMPPEQTLALGKMLLAQLHAQTVPGAWRQLFMLPARIHYVLSHTDTSKKVPTTAVMLNLYLAMQENYLQQHCPACVFQTLMKNYQTRPQIAADIVNRRCPFRSVEHLLNYGGGTCPNTFHALYGDPTEKFTRENMALADAYARLDKLMVATAWFKLGTEELAFMQRAEILLSHAEIVVAKLVETAPYALQKLFFPAILLDQTILASEHEKALEALSKLEIFMATVGDEIRIYHLNRRGSAYVATRVVEPMDAPFGSALQWLATYGEYFFDRMLFDPVLKNDGSGKILNQLCDKIVERHRKDFYEQMFNFGYQKTVLESIEDFALSLIPFYTCITEANKGNTASAAFACSIDLLFFIPVASQIANLSIKFGDTFYQGARIAITASSEIAARTTLKAALDEGAAQFFRHGLVPAGQIIGAQELKSLTIGIARAADPGVELMWTMGKASIRQAIALGKRIQHYIPELDKVISKIAPQEEKLAVQAHPEASAPVAPDHGHDTNALLADNAEQQSLMHVTAAPIIPPRKENIDRQRQPPPRTSVNQAAADSMTAENDHVSWQTRAVTGTDIRNWRQRLLQLNYLENDTMLKFAQEHQLELSTLLNFVRKDGSATQEGIRLIAQEHGRESPHLPSQQLLDEWNASPRNEVSDFDLIQNHGIDMFILANRHAVDLEDLANTLPAVQIMTQSGHPLLSESGARPMFGANVVLLSEEGPMPLRQEASAGSWQQLPAVHVAETGPSRHQSVATIISPPGRVHASSAAVRRKVSASVKSDRILADIDKTYPEHQLVWAGLPQALRDAWTMAGFAKRFNITPQSWHKLVTLNGRLKKTWKALKDAWSDGSAPPFNVDDLHQLQTAYRETGPYITQDAVNAFAAQKALSPELIRRYLAEDGSLTSYGENFKSLSNIANAVPDVRPAPEQIRFAASYSQESGSIRLVNTKENEMVDLARQAKFSRKAVTTKTSLFEHDLVWKNMSQELRDRWKLIGFADHFGLSRNAIYTRLHNHKIINTAEYEFGKAQLNLVTVDDLSVLQGKLRKHPLPVSALSQFAEDNGFIPLITMALLNGDGSLTEIGKEFVRITEEAAKGPPAESIAQTQALGPVVPDNRIASAQHPAEQAHSKNRRISSEDVVSDHAQGPIASQIKTEADALPARIHHQIDNDLPILQAPDDKQISLVHTQGLIDSLDITEWYELDGLLQQLPPKERSKIKRKITSEVHQWLHLGQTYGTKLEEKLQIFHDLSLADYAGMSVIAKEDIRQYEVLGPYAGALHDASDKTMQRAMRQQGHARVLSYLWYTPKGNFIDAYRRGNTLSLINTSEMKTASGISALGKNNNVAAIGVGDNFIFYVAKEDIPAGTELLVNYGSDYNPVGEDAIKPEPTASAAGSIRTSD